MSAPGHPFGVRAAALAARIGGLAGWRRSALAAALGAAAAAALPPAHALPLLVVSFTGLLWLIDGSRSPWRAALTGWWFGFAHFLASLYWIGAALLTDPSRFGWLVAPAVIGLSAGFALFPALAAFAARLPGTPIAGRVLAFAVVWSASEWLRSNILTGFPMNLMCTVWAPSSGMIQAVALIGVYGLGFVTVLAAASPAVLAASAAGGRAGRPRRLLPVAAFGLLAVLWAGGEVRLALAPDRAPTGVHLRLVQANVDQTLKWQEGERLAAVERHTRLSRRPGLESVDAVIWPEAAVPYFLDESAPLRAFVSEAAPPEGHLIAGAPRRTVRDGRTTAYWNSLHALTEAGIVAATYDKHHLVPFGEYIPLRALLDLSPMTYGERDHSAGPGPRTLSLPGLPPFSPLICYEAIFPGEVVSDRSGVPAAARPAWLLNVTNDGWFGHTAGPYQHFQAARLRAIEEGLPLVRAANTGISAVVDSYGRVVARLGLGETGILDAPLPPALGRPPIARLGDWSLALLLVPTARVAVLTIAAARARRRGQPDQNA